MNGISQISQNPLSAENTEDADFNNDEDPYDDISDDAPGLGILLRTDYSDEAAWQRFCARLQDAEAECTAEATSESAEDDDDVDMTETPVDAASTAHVAVSSSTDASGDSAMEDEEEDDENTAASPVFHVVNPIASSARRTTFTGISNLTALRLLNDVNIQHAPKPPQGTKRIRPPNRLIDHDGWQEVYSGKIVWIYDAKSNQDQCVRLVSQKGAAMYGTATGDSWRARVSHICELQVNLASGAMSIDFGGLDRWDYPERARNLQEAVRPVT